MFSVKRSLWHCLGEKEEDTIGCLEQDEPPAKKLKLWHKKQQTRHETQLLSLDNDDIEKDNDLNLTKGIGINNRSALLELEKYEIDNEYMSSIFELFLHRGFEKKKIKYPTSNSAFSNDNRLNLQSLVADFLLGAWTETPDDNEIIVKMNNNNKSEKTFYKNDLKLLPYFNNNYQSVLNCEKRIKRRKIKLNDDSIKWTTNELKMLIATIKLNGTIPRDMELDGYAFELLIECEKYCFTNCNASNASNTSNSSNSSMIDNLSAMTKYFACTNGIECAMFNNSIDKFITSMKNRNLKFSCAIALTFNEYETIHRKKMQALINQVNTNSNEQSECNRYAKSMTKSILADAIFAKNRINFEEIKYKPSGITKSLQTDETILVQINSTIKKFLINDLKKLSFFDAILSQRWKMQNNNARNKIKLLGVSNWDLNDLTNLINLINCDAILGYNETLKVQTNNSVKNKNFNYLYFERMLYCQDYLSNKNYINSYNMLEFLYQCKQGFYCEKEFEMALKNGKHETLRKATHTFEKHKNQRLKMLWDNDCPRAMMSQAR